MELGNSETNKLYHEHDLEYKYILQDNYIDLSNKNSSLSIIADLIADNSIVLDVGCSHGLLGKWLKTNKNCVVYGIDKGADVLNFAKQNSGYDDVFLIDLDNITGDNPAGIDFERFNELKEIFDYIILADVLEHLKNPTNALLLLAKKLKPYSNFLISIPDISNVDIILNLIEGRFNYNEFGILDNSHLRFFTKNSFIGWINSINESKILNEFKFQPDFIAYTTYLSDFVKKVIAEKPVLYNLLKSSNPEIDVLQNIFSLTKVKKEDRVFNLNPKENIKPLDKIYTILDELIKISKNYEQDIDNIMKIFKIIDEQNTYASQSIANKNDIIKNYGDNLNNEINYQNYINSFEAETSRLIKKNLNDILNSFKISPLISIIMPTYNTPEEYLIKAIKSVIDQTYENWELCIADDASTEIQVKKILKYYKEKDERIKVIYRTENGHISKASNSALSLAKGDYIALLDHDDELSEFALFFVVKEINDYPDAKLIYSDEDKLDEKGERVDPYFKSDWNPDLFLFQNMISHLGVYKKPIVQEIGGFREGYEGSQDYDLALRFIEKIKYDEIRHIPRILYHWRMAEGSTAINTGNKSYAALAARKAIQEHLDGKNIKAKVVEAPRMPDWNRVIYDIEGNPLVSIIIPTWNGYSILKKCIDCIIQKTSYKNYEIIVVNNNSDDEKTIKYLESINAVNNINVIDYNKPFNYSAINNFAVKFAKGEVLLLLNNDTEVINDDWLRELVSHALRPEVGAVGAKLLFPDDTVQHAGIIIGFGGAAGHCHHKIDNKDAGYFGRANLLQNYSAITGACLTVRKELYEKVNGLDEDLAVAFSDIDFCLKILKLGYYNVYTPYALLYHHESKSRGYEDTAEKKIRFREEINYFKKKWQNIIENDPSYNPNLTLDYKSFSLSSYPRIKFI